MSGPLVGGVIANRIGWQWAFWINIPTTAASFVAILFSFPEEKPRTPLFTLPMMEKIKRLDPIGSALLVITLSCLICALQDYSKASSLSTTGVIVAALAAGTLPLFLLQEILIRPDLALIPRSMIKRRSVWSCSCTLFFLFSGFTNFMFFVSIFNQVVQGQNSLQSAENLLPYLLSATIAAGITTACASTKVKYYNPFFMVGGSCFTIGMGLVSGMGENIAPITKFGYEILVGVGVGMMVLSNIAPIHIDIEDKDHALASGVTGLGGALGA